MAAMFPTITIIRSPNTHATVGQTPSRPREIYFDLQSLMSYVVFDCLLIPRRKTRTAMPKLTEAMDTMLDTLISGVVLGQPQVQIKRDGIVLAVNKMTGRSLGNSTVSAGTVDLKLVSDDEDVDSPVDIKVNGRA